METWTLVILLVLGAALAWQLIAGRTPGRGANALRRRDHPVGYWLIVGVQGAFIAFVAATRPASLLSLADEVAVGYREYRVGRALELIRGRQWADALAAYDELLAGRADDTRVRYGRGIALRHLGRGEEALAELRRVIARDPTLFAAYVEIDRILAERERWDEALAVWDDYLAHFPGNARAWYERGAARLAKGDRDAARADARRACDLGLDEACRRVATLEAPR